MTLGVSGCASDGEDICLCVDLTCTAHNSVMSLAFETKYGDPGVLSVSVQGIQLYQIPT